MTPTLDCAEEISFYDIDVNWFNISLLCLDECNFNKGSEILVILIRDSRIGDNWASKRGRVERR
jgi:hypothetical protein